MNSPQISFASARFDVPAVVLHALVTPEFPDSESVGDRTEGWLDDLARAVDNEPGVLVRIGALRLSFAESRQLARAIVTGLRCALIRRGAPSHMRVEVGAEQGSHVTAGWPGRVLLPHHDGLHCSFLTPSILDVPDWPPERRIFSTSGYKTTPAHKLYQGIFVIEPGEALSVTTYYDWTRIVKDAYAYETGVSDAPIEDIERWLGDNIRYALERQPEHQSRYLTIGAALGSRDVAHHAVSSIIAEYDVDPDVLDRHPEAARFREGCACSTCARPVQRALCDALVTTLGVPWATFRERYEVWVPSERFDLVLGHNLRYMHGGYLGGPSRRIEPLCLVVDEPVGLDYEQWLAASWR